MSSDTQELKEILYLNISLEEFLLSTQNLWKLNS